MVALMKNSTKPSCLYQQARGYSVSVLLHVGGAVSIMESISLYETDCQHGKSAQSLRLGDRERMILHLLVCKSTCCWKTWWWIWSVICLSKKFVIYIFPIPDSMAWKEDAFHHPWDHLNMNSFPPLTSVWRVECMCSLVLGWPWWLHAVLNRSANWICCLYLWMSLDSFLYCKTCLCILT